MASVYRAIHDDAYGLDSPSYDSSASTLASPVRRHGTDSFDDKGLAPAKRIDSMRLYAQSMYERETNIEESYEVSDLDDSEEDFKIQTGIPSKANRLLGLDTSHQQPKRNNSIKSHKSLLKSKPPPVDPFPIQTLPTDTENIAPKALRTLGIRSNALTRPPTSNRENHPPPQNSPHVPFDPDDFNRTVSTNQRTDNSSNTDTSSLSRESTLSWRTETPRSSQEVHLDELKWNHRPAESAYRPSAVLTEPFSPVSCRTFSQFSPDSENAFVFELPADIPAAKVSDSKPHFIAELPAAELETTPIFELPALPPDVVELPAAEPDIPCAAESSPAQARLSEPKDGTVSKEVLTTTAEESSLETYQLQPTVYQKPTTTKQASGLISVAVELAQMPPRHPATASISSGHGEHVTRAQSYEALTSRSRKDQVMKSKSAEFDLRRVQVPGPLMSPPPHSTRLATFVTNTGTSSQKASSSQGSAHGLVARSKYNAESVPRVSTMFHGLHPSLREQNIMNQERNDTWPQTTSTAMNTSPVEDYPESPVTGHLAGQPIFRSQTLPVPDRSVLGSNEIPVQLEFPSPPKRTDSPQSLPAFYHKDGYI